MRQHGHAVEEENRRLMIKDFGLGIDFAGGLRWGGKGVRLEVHRDEAENAWYASVQLKVSAETTQN
ncbi:MAG: transposase, partial [Candidatus Marsarchaeota archaeon]